MDIYSPCAEDWASACNNLYPFLRLPQICIAPSLVAHMWTGLMPSHWDVPPFSAATSHSDTLSLYVDFPFIFISTGTLLKISCVSML